MSPLNPTLSSIRTLFAYGALLCTSTTVFADPARFVDVAAEVGLTDVFYCGSDKQKDYIIEILGGGVALLDYNRDGFLDAFFVSGSTLEGFPSGMQPSNQLYRNNRDGTFTNATKEAGLLSEGWGQGVCVGDVDNDGFDDLFVTSFGENHLFRNSGDASFVDVSMQSGLSRDKRWSTGCAFLDYDGDGALDLFVANYIIFDRERIPKRGSAPSCRWKGQPVLCGPRGLPGETNELYRNIGNGRFEDVSEDSGISGVKDRYSLSVTTLDFNRDGLVDIYVAVDSQASILFRNQADGTFEDVGIFSGVAFDEHGSVQAGMGSAAGDIDGDGNLDLIKTNFIDEPSNIYLSSGDESFEDHVYAISAGAGTRQMGWGVGVLDFDRDSWPDLIVANGHVYPEIEPLVPNSPYRQRRTLYRNVEGRRLEDISLSSGPGVLAPHSSRGLALGDYDNDGDVDVFINNMNERPSVLRNDSTPAGGFLSIRLIGVASNRSAIGARVTVTIGDKKMVQEVRSGSSFMSNHDSRLHFGLGDHERVEKIDVDWPHASSRDTVSGVVANQFIEITQGKGLTARK